VVTLSLTRGIIYKGSKMTPEQFAYWLQGFVELTETRQFSEQQTQIIKDHLKLVFDKRTPTYPSNPVPKTYPLDPLYNQPRPWPEHFWTPGEPYKVTC
jgi:hypothetical protein